MSDNIRRKDILSKDLKILWAKTGNQCAMPGCNKALIIDETDFDTSAVLGVMAHIKGEKLGAARYDQNMTEDERRSHNNLIALCPDCHTVIDEQPNTYTVEKLQKISN